MLAKLSVSLLLTVFFAGIFISPVYAQLQGTTTPPFNGIFTCPGNPACPSAGASPSSPVNQPTSNISPQTPTISMTNGAPSISPCQTADTSVASNNKKSKHWHHGGGMSGFMETLMKFFMELINMLLKLFGGTPIDIPSDGNPLPTDNPENPGVTTEPNQPNPTEPVEQQPQPCAPTESPSIAPVISNSVNPSTPPQSIPSVAPSISISNAPAGWKLTFADEFEGTSVAPTWSKIPYGLGQACLVMDNNNLKVANGNLVITATATNSSSCKWTSGGMQSLGKFSQHYGRFEMRAKLPADNLAWPAFWLLPEDNSYDGEIDILETIGGNNMDINGTLLPGNKHGAFTLHVPAGGPGPTKSCAVTPDFSSDYHLYTLEWTAEGMKMFIDNVQCANFTGYSDSGTNPPAFPATFNKPYFILVNLAIAPTSWGIQPPTTTTMTMDVDYIRVWQKQ